MPHGFSFHKEAPPSQLFPFVCTNVDTTRLYGACLVFYEQVSVDTLGTYHVSIALFIPRLYIVSLVSLSFPFSLSHTLSFPTSICLYVDACISLSLYSHYLSLTCPPSEPPPQHLAKLEHAYAARCLCALSKTPMHATMREVLSQLWMAAQESPVKPLMHPLEDCM